MKYKCDICGSEFEEPTVHEYLENLDGENGVEHRREEYCPVCHSPHFSDVGDIPEIVLRFRDFIHSGYGIEEMRQLDDELDGDSFEDYWRRH